jgi:hypothetical protein
MTYSFRDSIHRFDDSAITPEIAGKELERIYDKHGALRAQVVVDEARPDDAPLHPAFEWNDLVAAEYYRREQARSLIKTVQVVREDENDETKNEPVYVNVGTKESSYQPISKVVNTPDMFETAFSQACARIGSARRALAELQEVAKRERRPECDRYQRAERLIGQAETVMLKGA